MADGPTSPKRVCLTMEDIESLPRDELLNRWKEQEMYVNKLEEKRRAAASRGDEGKESEEKLKQQHIEAARRENTLVMRLTSKEQELQEYMTQIQEMKTAQSPSTAQLRSMLLDPAVNLVFTRMQKEMKESKEKLEQTQNELSAWRFTPDSQTGKRLMAKCRMLYQENEELGKVLSSGKIAKLEGEIALEKTLVQEMKKSQAELDEFLGEIDEDVEGMQSMICVLQQQLKDAKEQVTQLTEENRLLKADRQVVDRDLPMAGIGCGDSPHRVPVHSPQPWQALTEPMARCEPEEIRSPSDPATLTDNHLADEVEAGGGEEGMEVDSVEHRHDTADSQPETPPLASSPRTIDTPELTEPVTASSNHTTTNSQASPPATPHTDSQPSPQAASPPPRSPGRENGAVRTKEGDRDPEALAGGDAAQDKVHNGVADSWQQGETTTA